MSSTITNEVLEALQHCRLKAYFLLHGEERARSDYEELLLAERAELRPKAMAKIERDYGAAEMAADLDVSIDNLRRGIPFILNAPLHDDRHTVLFDGLRRIAGTSALGDFHYEPVMFCTARRVRVDDRRHLAMLAVLLARVQGAVPPGATVYLGRDATRTAIRLGAGFKPADSLLREAERLQRADTPPKLLLNDHCRICAFHDRCREKAIREDHLSLLRGLGERSIKRYTRKGVLTLIQLAHTFRPRRRGKRADAPVTRRDHALHALAIRDRTIYVFGAPKLPTAPVRIYLDMEGDPEDRFVYLIGLIICDGEGIKHHAFWADERQDEASIFAQFLDAVSSYDVLRIYCYGNYEKTFITRMRQWARRKRRVDGVLAALTNVLTIIYPHVYFPTYSNGLKEVGTCLGCSWTEPNASGIASVVWRKHWERTRDVRWKEKLLQYNLEDCQALSKVCDFLSESPERGAGAESDGAPRTASVAQLDKLSRTVTWSKFAHADFDFVNKRAYFDYQRQHVFARTKPRPPKRANNRPPQRRWQNRDLRPTHRVEVTATSCPFCKGKEIIPLGRRRRPKGVQTRRKRAFDLVITPGAVRRKVIEFHAVVYRCSECDRCFIPERYERLARHFHGFMSWFAYQQITHNLGIKSLAALFYEIFGIRVNWWEFLAFRYLLARRYRRTYNLLLAKLISGPVLHIDETEIKLNQGSGYVWVFANTSTALYMFRPSREGDFLRAMLKDFRGVLVSDFYLAYDGLDCPQQRCLIHLMRDMNRLILDNPFDQGLQTITTPFGAILRAIVATIDEHGLKRRQLQTHAKSVTTFFQAIEDCSYESDPAKTLRQRLLRNRDRLFTFLDHNGVSWNNNLAENAIKRISTYRENVRRTIKKAGLIEHLVLLSLYQTCRVRDVSFLKFLLSRERDMDTFTTGKRRRRRGARIELYPKGYLPPAIVSLRRGKRNPAGDAPTPIEASNPSPDS
jgi:predicted RecB family nuclease